MIRPIMTKRFFLRLPSEEATEQDLAIARDLEETLEAHRATCVGMAANMIGWRKRIIAVADERGDILVMLNPVVLDAKEPYQTEEGCLSLEGVRPTTRYRRITVQYDDLSLNSCKRTFLDRVAQAVQHEIDHCNGVVI